MLLKKNIRKNQQHITLDKEKACHEVAGNSDPWWWEKLPVGIYGCLQPRIPLGNHPLGIQHTANRWFFLLPPGLFQLFQYCDGLSQSLTSSNQYNNMPLGESVDLVSLAKKAGYHTYWFSTQGKGEVWDAAITTLASQADTGNGCPGSMMASCWNC